MTGEDGRTSAAADIVRAARLVVVLRRIEPVERLIETVDALVGIGVRAFEVTMDTADAGASIRSCRDHLDRRDDGPFAVGAGTILDLRQVHVAHAAGAMFGVAPVLDLAVLAGALDAGLPFVPGCFTPTEAYLAWREGATFVKLFPASALGPSFVRELKGPLPDIEVIPTGGVDATNAAAFLEAGATAVGIGGSMIRADAATRVAIVRATAASR